MIVIFVKKLCLLFVNIFVERLVIDNCYKIVIRLKIIKKIKYNYFTAFII